MLSPYGKASIAILTYFVIALPIAIYVCIRQGFGRQLGWFYLVTLPIVRIVGAATRLAAEEGKTNNAGLYTAAAICSSIGLIPLLLTFMGMMKRVNDGMRPTHITSNIAPKIFRLTHLMAIVALPFAILAGVDSIPGNSNLSNAITYRKVSAILFLLVAIINVAFALLLALNIRETWEGDRIIVWCSNAASPFLIVRVAYTVLLAFDKNPTFNWASVDIYVQAFMQILMEFIVFALLCTAGLMAATMKHGGASGPANKHHSDPGSEYAAAEQQELGHLPARY